MQNDDLILTGSTAVVLMSFAFFNQSHLAMIVAIVAGLLSFSGALFVSGRTRWHWLNYGLQLIMVVCLSQFNWLLWFLLPVSTFNLFSGWWRPKLMLGLFSVSLIVGGWYLTGQALFWYGIWTLFLLGLTGWGYVSSQQQQRLTELSDELRHERNRLATLVSQHVSQADAREQQAAATERQRLVHQIHDQLGHELTGSLMQLQAAKISYRTDSQQGEQLLDQSITVVRTGIEDIRQILHTEQLATETVKIDQIKGELQRFTDVYQIPTNFRYSGELQRISPAQWQVMLANLKEGLTNTLKYSAATKIDVQLHVFQRFVRLTMHNNGRSAPVIKKGLGLMGMEERTAALSGTLIVDGKAGFEVTTVLPI